MPITSPRDIPNPEIALAVVSLGLAALAARFGFQWLGWWERPLNLLAQRKMLAILIAGATPLILRAALLPWFPMPEPRVHDEFTFLLGADTFLHGRVANPQHPFWYHFQSPHILSRPTYTSAFPMAQSAILAIGGLLGHPWIGVWLSAGLMCAAFCWMLQGWVPARWALLGALLAILRFAVSSYWANSYWGGCVAATGGALVLGAIPRIVREPKWTRALPLGIGLAILANSRPLEGSVFGAVSGVVLIVLMAPQRPRISVVTRQLVLPLALILAITAAGMSYSFMRITGKPWVVPYLFYRQSMSVAPHFIWQLPRPEPMYSSRELRDFYVHWEIREYSTPRGYRALRNRVTAYQRFYIGPLFAISMTAALFLWRNKRTRLLWLMGAGFSLVLAGQVWHNAHYAAPATGLVILIVVQGLRALRLWRPPLGLAFVRCVPIACAGMLAIQIAMPREDSPSAGWRWPSPGGIKRARVLRELQGSEKKQLVFVRYGALHDWGDEWVYNDSGIDRARVVWARELDPGSNAKLMRYFGDREVKLVEPDFPIPRLMRYSDAPFRPMKFVQLDAPGIDALRSADLKDRVIAKVQAGLDSRLSCDVWSFYFTEATGVSPPSDSSDCFGNGDRRTPVSLDHWFVWLAQQR